MRSVSFWGKFTSGSRISVSRSDLLKVPNFSADGTKAFEIGSNVLNLVFGDESVMEDSEV